MAKSNQKTGAPEHPDTANIQTAPEGLRSIVILAHAPSEITDLSLGKWKQYTDPQKYAPSMLCSVKSLCEILSEIVADSAISEHFVVVSNGCIPLSPIADCDLELLKMRNGQMEILTPILLDKKNITDVLIAGATDENILEQFVKKAFPFSRPLEIASTNFVGCVFRDNPNIEAVREALAKRKFLYANQKGYEAIRPILAKLE